ncbi:MAG: hypothetical protein ACRDOK_24320, partial [Streptosporangiaceae bacterium]
MRPRSRSHQDALSAPERSSAAAPFRGTGRPALLTLGAAGALVTIAAVAAGVAAGPTAAAGAIGGRLMLARPAATSGYAAPLLGGSTASREARLRAGRRAATRPA